jgi:alpha-mannosidase
VLVISQSSHLDWDWLFDFESYFVGQVDEIFLKAFDLLALHADDSPGFYYSIAEVGFLERFFDAHPQLHPRIASVGNNLRIVGGGITSPDNLLPNGEAFMRDYLVGKTWIDRNLPLPIRQAWLPDDFGHDLNLPIVMEAMGMMGVGIARVPGVDTHATFNGSRQPEQGTMAADLRERQLDFIWRSPDGSEVITHWMPESYCQGDKIDTVANGNFMDFLKPDATDPKSTNARISEFIGVNSAGSPTPYIFVPIGCDFADPKAGLLDYTAAWNETEYESTGIWAVAATFDHYIQLLSFHRDKLAVREFDPTPYWMGYYASRTLLKTTHHAATRALLAAEAFGALADGLFASDAEAWKSAVNERTARIHDGWAKLVPSNHHDYITGTAPDGVYQAEQVPLINEALAVGAAQRDTALRQLADSIAAEPARGETAVAVFNPLGFARTGLATMAGEHLSSMSSVRHDDGTSPLQQAGGDGLLFRASAPSFGYSTAYLGAAGVARDGGLGIRETDSGNRVILENEFLRAVIEQEAAWGITSLIDLASGAELIRPGEIANEYVIYKDGGGLYQFGHEIDECAFAPHIRPGSAKITVGDGSIIESGSLRVKFRTRITMEGQHYVRDYSLVAGEPYLRIHAEGAAPEGTSVMVHIPLASSADGLLHGTPYHWSIKSPERAIKPTFEATHDFLAPRSGEQSLAAIYHAGIPAWALTRDGMLIGALWRNTPKSCEFIGAEGRDDDEHIIDYAIRIPSGAGTPEQGLLLRESLEFQNPLIAIPIGPNGDRPVEYSLASVEPLPAILRAAKAASNSHENLILRIYQPTNTSLGVHVKSAAESRFPAGKQLVLHPTTALEEPLPTPQAEALSLQGSPAEFSFTARRALSTVSIGY